MKTRQSARIITLISLFMALCGSAVAGTIEFRGTINSIQTPASSFDIGDDVVLRYTLTEPLVDLHTSGDLADELFVYQVTDFFLSVGSVVSPVDLQVLPLTYPTQYNNFGLYGPNFFYFVSVSNPIIESIAVTFVSTKITTVTPDGILVDGQPLSDFFQHSGYLYEVGGGVGLWDITDYSVTGFSSANTPDPTPAVPDSTATAEALGLSLIGLICFRVRQNLATVACR